MTVPFYLHPTPWTLDRDTFHSPLSGDRDRAAGLTGTGGEHSAPYTLLPTFYALHATPYTLHSTTYTPIPYT